MKFTECTIITVILFLMMERIIANNCSKPVSWMKIPRQQIEQKTRFPGQWLLFNCSVNTSDHVTLWFRKNRKSDEKLQVIDKKMMLVSKNIFNITRLTDKDRGFYICRVCGQEKQIFAEILKGIANARPIIKKIPNKALYDIGDEVKLTCRAENTTNGYEIKWYKISSNRELIEMEKAKSEWVGEIQHETLLLKSLSAQDMGIYMCKIYFLEYSAFEEVNLNLKVPLKPDIQMLNEQNNFHPNEGKGFSLLYNVSSYPASDIKWWRSEDGKEYDLITQCLATKMCEVHGGKENITKTSFEIEDLRFPQDNFFYKCNASNGYGKASETFQLEVYVKPEINMQTIYRFKEGLLINCSLKRSNPSEVKFTWYSCSTPNCGEKSQNLTEKSFLRLDSQLKSVMKYQCRAKNAAGNASKIIEVFKSAENNMKPEINMQTIYRFKEGMIINCSLKRSNPSEVKFTWYSCNTPNCGEKSQNLTEKSFLRLDSQLKSVMKYQCNAKNAAGSASKIIVVFKSAENNSIPNPTSSDQRHTLILIVVPTGLISMIIVVVAGFVLYRRKKIYGGFYLFSYPPLPDYIEIINRNGNIQEQIQQLPFIPEWEFPRERISFDSELGSGQFGIVWLAEAIGISAFHPRDMLRDREGGRRFSFFNRTTKRNSYVFCTEVTQVAVKTMKENFDRNDLADLQSELKILIHVGENENIVNILGACTKGKSSNLWIIMEYCPNGNLREFLQNNQSRYSAEEESFDPDISQVFGPRNIIYVAWQIAKGMTFLTSRKIIHRDLAARNILLGRGYVAKVSDFGLARDVHKHEQYLKTSTGLVPFKWMALESIRDSLFTEKSDVWSFGILLWEIFSLGETPYPGMYFNDVHQYLLQGKRMEPPIHCPGDINDVMSMCWKETPEDRPNFQSLKDILYEILDWKEISQTSAYNDEIVNGPLKSNVIASAEDVGENVLFL